MSTPPKTCDAGIKEKAIGKIAFQNPSYMDRYFAAYGKVTIFSAFPTLASGASIARGCPPPFGGAHLAPSLRSRRDRIGQKPEPTYLFFAERKGKPKETKTKNIIVRKENYLGRSQTETISLHVTPEEKKAMVERMKEAVSPSMRAFILDMCMNGKIIVNSDLRELNQELRYQGNNLNQLTKLCHQGRIYAPELTELLMLYRQILLALGGENDGGC